MILHLSQLVFFLSGSMKEWARVGASALLRLRSLPSWARCLGRRTALVRLGSLAEKSLCRRFFMPGRVLRREVVAVRLLLLHSERFADAAVAAMEEMLSGSRRNMVRLVESLEWARADGSASSRLAVCERVRMHFSGREDEFERIHSACALLIICGLLLPAYDGIECACEDDETLQDVQTA